ncbi:Collagenase-related protease [Archaeoglobus sulfaticallidus PM70-1]|uniref:Collagenase-related protease n=2 Tax=Archaeoglobus TaxID=2233 RepID=N0BDG7_9EURY|nr:Collagenase-related protease [Archaeoglobus sulfaticallidus PM70-1]
MELVTNIPTLEQMSKCSIEPYDAIYLGNPYCMKYDGNLTSNFEDLRIAVEMLREMGKRVYISTFSAPRNSDLPEVFRLIDLVADLEVDAIESTNFGVISYVKREYDLRVHAGGLTNIYTSATVELLKSIGVERVMPAYELPLEDIAGIKAAGVEVEVVVHGKIPLGISHECFLLEFEKNVGVECPHICKREMVFRSGDLVLKPFGHATLSGKDVCMYEHIDELRKVGVDALRVETISERIGYREKVGNIYRNLLERGFDRNDFEKLMEIAKYGICNGFYFNKAGQIYVGSEVV